MIKAHFVTVLTKQLLLKHNVTDFKVKVCEIADFIPPGHSFFSNLVGQTSIHTIKGKQIKIINIEKNFVRTHSFDLVYQNILHEVAHAIIATRWPLWINKTPYIGQHGLLWKITAWRIGYRFPKGYSS